MRIVQTVVLIMMAVVSTSCISSRPVNPTKDKPVPACYIGCPDGYMFRRQHLCRGGKRWFTDVLLVGSYTQRGADGGLLVDTWIDSRGQLYDKQDIEIGMCSSVISGVIQSRATSERGQYPGESNQGQPSPP